ncbi:MAG: transposase [bacterium]
MITAAVVQSAITSDHGSIGAVLEAHAANVGCNPEEVFGDAGYVSAPALREASAQGYELTGPVAAPPHSGARFGSDSFAVDIPGRLAVCPAGIASSECSRIAESGRNAVYYYFAWPRAACASCPLREKCLSKKKRTLFRTLQVGDGHMSVQERRNLCKTPEYRIRMKRRSGIEGSHSELKRGYGLRRCRYRGLPKTDVQNQFTSAACNLRRWSARLCWLARKNG